MKPDAIRCLAVMTGILLLSSPSWHPSMAQEQTANALALTGARLIDGTGRAPIDDATLLVENGRIVAVGPASMVPIPDGVTRVALDGKTVMPGLVNAHGHVQVMPDSTLPVREDLLRRLRSYASYGVTTVVSLGSGPTDEVAGMALRDEQRAGRVDGARFYTSGRAVAGRTPEESRAAVDRLADLGADYIKLRLNGNPNDPDFATFRAQVERAHARGLRTVVHIFNLRDAQLAVDAGIDVIGHSVRDQDVTPGFIAALKERNVPYVPTLTRDLSVFVYETTPAFFTDPFFLRGRALYGEQLPALSDPVRQRQLQADPEVQAIKLALAQAVRNLKSLADAGVAIAFGTDSGAAGAPGRWQGYFEHVELEMMVEAGLTPLQALTAATGGAAKAMGLVDQGSLETGKIADFVVLDADPLANIRNTRQIDSVWMSGRQIDLVTGTSPQ